MSIATKTGDDGSTGLMFNRRVRKNDPRVIAYGTCDELNAALGMARAWNLEPFIASRLFEIQKELVILMGELACAEEDRERYAQKGFHFVEESMVVRLTDWIVDLEKNHRISFKHWATPGATQGSATLDHARATCRRAERAVWDLKDAGYFVNESTPRYLNRLSDLCWLLARYVETNAENAEKISASSGKPES
jgi:cob(I)alamin adenosyltransferase